MATTTGPPVDTTNPTQLKDTRFTEDFDNTNVQGEQGVETTQTGTPPKKSDSGIGRKVSLRKSGSKRSPHNDYAQQFAEESNDPNSALVSPIPTQVNPTEVLALRFNNWRRVLKEFATFFKEIASQYETRSKSFSRVQSCLNTTLHGDTFLHPTGGLAQTHKLLSSFHTDQRLAAETARQIEQQIVTQLNSVRNDLGQKVKEIKGLSSDFKNNVDKEKEATRRAIIGYLDALSALSSNNDAASKQDPFLVKLSVERQIRKLLAEENYLHRAFLNIETSGRELESIVVQEIQKAFRTYGEIIKNEGATNINFSTSLDQILLQMPPDSEWAEFIKKDSNFVSPDSPLRTLDMIHYPGHDSPATTEIRSGPLERKSKYLKSFSPGWFVLSPTYLHEFKTSDRSVDQTPVMSLYLPDSTIGDHSNAHAVNHKFMLKGKRTGALHRGHTWVFRAATHEAMLEWYEDIRKLTELSGSARDNFVGRRRTLSISQKNPPVAQIEEDDEDDQSLMVDDEDVPYSAHSVISAVTPEPYHDELAPPKRPEAGRFGSDFVLGPEARYNSSEEAIAGVHGLPGSSAIGYGGENRPSSKGSTWSYDENKPQYQNSQALPPVNQTAPLLGRDSGNFDNTGPIPSNTIRKQASGTFIHQPQAQAPGNFNPAQYDQNNQGLNVAQDPLAPSSTRNNMNVGAPSAVFVPGKTGTNIDPTPTVGAYDGTSPAPIARDSYHPPAPIAPDTYDPTTSGTLPGQQMSGDAIIPIENTDRTASDRPEINPVPGTSQSTLENIHFPGSYPRQ